LKPDYHDAWSNRGVALYNLGQLEEAIASYDKALQIKADYHNAWSNRGVVLENLGQIEEAIASYDKALQIKPDDHLAWYNRGVALEKLGKFEEAIALYDKALKIKPDYHDAWLNRGVALYHLGQLEEAIASYDKALQFKLDSHLTWLGRGAAAGSSVSCNQLLAFMSSIARQNPALNQRGYEGKLASYQEGLKHCQQETHPEGWGELHRAIGNAHYFRGKGKRDYRKYWHTAVAEYHQALITLTEEEKLRELHLGVVQDLVRVLFGLGKDAEAEELQRRGTDLLRRLLSEPKRTNYSKKQLALKFVSFQQLTVDQAVQSQQLVKALELAEKGKNACLTWLLDGYSEEISSPSYTAIQQLLSATTAIIYWHLSPAALTTFIIKHGAEEPIVIKEPFPSPPVKPHDKPNLSFQHLHDFETWVNNWDKQYQEYRSKEKNSPPQPPLKSRANSL
jgi:tetratricopeptide (TPR) repeat protein